MILAREQIVVVDDSLTSLKLLERILKEQGYDVHPFADGSKALSWIREHKPDLVLLDILMSGMDGFDLCCTLKLDARLCDTPVIFISSLNNVDHKVKAFSLGCVDYITKPFEQEEIKTRVETHLRLRQMRLRLENQNQELERLIQEKVKEISDSWIAAIFALAKLAESRDDDTGNHLERVQSLCRMLSGSLARQAGYRDVVDERFMNTIYYTSPLHDIGKVGIPDSILLKPGRLDPGEMDIMRQHTIIGARTLEAARKQYQGNLFLEMGIVIARSHHERWDGAGYPDGLRGDGIPLSARIVAVADVYDALRSNRPYKKTMPHEKAVSIIREGRGSQFAPDIVDCFLELEDSVLEMIVYPEN